MKPKIEIGTILTLAIFLIIPSVKATELIWLSNMPPKAVKKEIRFYGMHRLPALRGKDHRIHIIQWIRSGRSPEFSEYVQRTNTGHPELFVFSPSEEPIHAQLLHTKLGYLLSFPDGEEGFYNAYLVEKFVHRDTLTVLVAKAERLSHSCRNGHKGVLKKVPPKIHPQVVPLEIVRKRLPGENFHTIITAGDRVTFQILLHGVPLSGASVRLCTQKGWSKQLTTSQNGEATFQLIQDYLSRWQDVKRRVFYHFLVTVDYLKPEEGTYQGKPYHTVRYLGTYSDIYRPSQLMYSSYVWGLFVILSVILIASLAIYLYRKRSKIEFREIAFDEKA